eukprot:444167-Rhodomonas_salina.1
MSTALTAGRVLQRREVATQHLLREHARRQHSCRSRQRPTRHRTEEDHGRLHVSKRAARHSVASRLEADLQGACCGQGTRLHTVDGERRLQVA